MRGGVTLKRTFLVQTASVLQSEHELGSDPRQAEAEVLLGAEDRPAQPADGPGGGPRREQRPDQVSRFLFKGRSRFQNQNQRLVRTDYRASDHDEGTKTRTPSPPADRQSLV